MYILGICFNIRQKILDNKVAYVHSNTKVTKLSTKVIALKLLHLTCMSEN